MLHRRHLLAATPLLAAPAVLRAQGAWPNRTLTMVVPFPPGGSTDILGRAAANWLSKALGQTVLVENRGGAGGSVGAEYVARAAPDGYTLMMGHIGTLAVNPTLYPRLAYDPVRDFAPVALMAIVPNVLVVHPSLAAQNVAEFIALAKAQPGGLEYGSGGNGSAAHIAMAAFCDAAGVEMTHVPYRGTAPMMTDLMAGRLKTTLTGGPAALPPARAGQLRALGVSSLQRLHAAPELPTIAEGGLPGFEAVQWYGVVAPANTPPAIVQRLNQEMAAGLRDPDLSARLASEGAEPAPRTPEAFGAFIATEKERWGALIRKTNMTPD